MKLAVVVQRYGADISGGAELHARYIAERLARHADGRGADDLRARLHHLEERAAGRRREGQRRRACAGFRSRGRATRTSSAAARSSSSNEPHSIADELQVAGERRARRARRSIRHIAAVPATLRLLRVLQLPLLPRVARRARRAGQGGARADGRARSGDRPRRSSRRVFRGVRALMYNSFEERALIQHVSGRKGPGVVVGVGSEIPDADAAVAVQEEVQRQAAVRDLHRPDRREQGLQGAVLVLRALRGDVPARARSRARRHRACMPVPKHPRIRHLGFLSGRGQVRRARGGRRADHAVAVREPVDGGARGVGARQARAGQRALRRAARPGDPQQRRALLRDVRGVRRSAVRARGHRPARRACSAATAASSSGVTTRGRSSSGSTSRCSSG